TGGAISGTSITVKDDVFTLQDNVDATKQARFELSGLLTAQTTVYTLPVGFSAASLLLDAPSTQTINGIKTFSSATINVGSSANASTQQFAYGATASGNTKTVNVGTGGVSGSTTTIAIGSSVSGATSTTTMNGTTNIAAGSFNGTVGATTPSTGAFTTVTNSGLTSGRVVYTTTGGLQAASANLTFNGTTLTAANDMSVAGMTVGVGGGAVAQNAAFGGVTLPFNTTGNFNVAVGYQSMFWNKTGSSNVGLGFATLFLNTTANQNLAMGVSSLTVLTTNVATFGAITAGSGYTNGTYTAVAMTPVSGATFVTYPTVTVVVSGGAVTSVTLVTAGQGASSQSATVLTVAAALIGGTGSGFSIQVGSFAAGANNTAIGYQAGYTLVTGSNNTLIGYQATASTTSVNNEITLGNSLVTAFRIPGLAITAGAKWMNFGSSTVALLASAATAGVGARAFVTDALAPTFGSTVAGGGAVASPVYSDGTNWKVG
ncbi:hypothetical protein UFOVP66_56, partial [uncultured Caudovirales phage]